MQLLETVVQNEYAQKGVREHVNPNKTESEHLPFIVDC